MYQNKNYCIIISLLYVYHLLPIIIRKRILIWISVEKLILILRLQLSLCLKIISFLLILPILRILHLLFKLIGYKFFNLSIRKLIIIYKDLLILLYHYFKFRNKLGLWMLCKLIYHCFKGILIRIIFRNWRKICLLF
jgi:hypothetical protein